MKKLAPAPSTVPVRRDLLKMHARLKAALSDPSVLANAHQDLCHTLCGLEGVDISHAEASSFLGVAFEYIRRSDFQLLALEKDIRAELGRRFPGFAAALADGLSGRARIITEQLGRYIRPGARIADLGCGDGKVAASVTQAFQPSYLIGFDVVNYLADSVNINFRQFDGMNVPICLPDQLRSFDYVLLTNVLHHAELNGWLIVQAHRLLKPGGKLLVHETVPNPETYSCSLYPKEVQRVFVLDYFYNRILHDADISVPGTYEMIKDWTRRFEFGGLFQQTAFENFGIDQPLIRDLHVLYELEAIP